METTRGRPVLTYILLALMIMGIAAAIALSALAVSAGRDAVRMIEERLPLENTETREDDVEIGSYHIRSTTAISDAYKSGDSSALDDKQREVLDMASAALEEIVTDGMTDFEKEKAVYDWMTHNLQQDRGLLTVIPTSQADCDNPYGVLKYHNAVCVGYATTFRLFMHMLDIPCMVVHNSERYHSWDLVQLDGEWYHTDIYSDAGRGNYTCFNISDAMMQSRGQQWDTAFFPAASGVKYNMAYLNSVPGIGPNELPGALRKALDDGESTMLSFHYGSDFTEARAQLAAEAVRQVQELLWQYGDRFGNASFDYAFNRVEDGYLFVISIYRSEDGEELVTDEDREAIANAVQEAFKDLEEGQDGGEPPAESEEPVPFGGAAEAVTSAAVLP